MGKDNFRRLTEQDLGKAFIREVPRKDSERFGYYSVLQSRAAAEERRKQLQAKLEQYGKPEGVSFIEEGDLETTAGKYVLWIDDKNACYRLDVYPSGKDAIKRSMKWGYEPRFVMDIEDSWKLFGNAKLGIKGLLQEMEEQTRETGT